MRQPEPLLEELARHKQRGFRATELRIGLGVVGLADGPRDQRRDAAILRGARELFGPDFAIGADTDKTYDHVMAHRLAPLVQPDVNHCGGLTPLCKIAHMAAGRGLRRMPRLSCHLGSDVILMATGHLLGSMRNGMWLCYQAYGTPLRTELLKEPVVLENGDLVLGSKPGLGIDLDPRALARYAVEG